MRPEVNWHGNRIAQASERLLTTTLLTTEGAIQPLKSIRCPGLARTSCSICAATSTLEDALDHRFVLNIGDAPRLSKARWDAAAPLPRWAIRCPAGSTGPLTTCVVTVAAALHETEGLIAIRDEGLENLIRGSKATMEQVLGRALGNWYIEASEARFLGVIAGAL